MGGSDSGHIAHSKQPHKNTTAKPCPPLRLRGQCPAGAGTQSSPALFMRPHHPPTHTCPCPLLRWPGQCPAGAGAQLSGSRPRSCPPAESGCARAVPQSPLNGKDRFRDRKDPPGKGEKRVGCLQALHMSCALCPPHLELPSALCTSSSSAAARPLPSRSPPPSLLLPPSPAHHPAALPPAACPSSSPEPCAQQHLLPSEGG